MKAVSIAIYLRGTELSRLRHRAECEAFAAMHYPACPWRRPTRVRNSA